MKFFKPEDFDVDGAHKCISQTSAADTANRILDDQGHLIYGHIQKSNGLISWDNKSYTATHRAILVCIEIIPETECIHEPTACTSSFKRTQIIGPCTINFYDEQNWVCSKCKITLKATWSPA